MDACCGWEIGDGRKVSFWRDKWVGSMPPLSSLVNNENLILNKDATVAEMTLEDGNWDFDAISSIVPSEVGDWIRGIHPPVEGISDRLKWLGEQNGAFTVKSCYQKFMGESLGIKDSKWKCIWDWKGLERIRFFLWIVGHDRLNTNSRRATWCGCSALCAWCDNMEENTTHILRDYRIAKEIWLRLLPGRAVDGFFNMRLWDWLESNLIDAGAGRRENWSTFFTVTCWLLWKWRNKRIFDSSFVMPSDPVRVIEWWVSEISIGNKKTDSLCEMKKNDQSYMLRWWPPCSAVVKVNSDAAVVQDSSLASCAALIRDENGVWCGGMTRRLGRCSVLVVELWGILEGLKLAWDLGFKDVVIESDSLLAVNLVKKNLEEGLEGIGVERSIQRMLKMNWVARVSHVLRECNRSADVLAKFGLSLSDERMFWSTPPDCLGLVLFEDGMGACVPRGF